jgi:hypothetical protein
VVSQGSCAEEAGKHSALPSPHFPIGGDHAVPQEIKEDVVDVVAFGEDAALRLHDFFEVLRSGDEDHVVLARDTQGKRIAVERDELVGDPVVHPLLVAEKFQCSDCK